MNRPDEGTSEAPPLAATTRDPLLGIFIFLAAVPAYILSSFFLSRVFGLLAGSAASQVLFFAVLPLLALRILRVPLGPLHLAWPQTGTRAVSWVLVPVLVLLFFQYEMVQETYLYSSEEQLRALYEETFRIRTTSLPLLLLCVGLLPALCEEILFRGLLLGSTRRFVGAPGAVLVSAILFAAVHPIPVVLPPIFLLGLLLGTLTALSRSILPAVAVHFLNNFLVILFLARPGLGEGAGNLFPMNLGAFALLVAAFVLLAVAGWKGVKRAKGTKDLGIQGLRD